MRRDKKSGLFVSRGRGGNSRRRSAGKTNPGELVLLGANPNPAELVLLGNPSMQQRAKVRRVMHEFGEGILRTRGGRKVKSRGQAVAMALREAGIPKRNGQYSPSPAGEELYADFHGRTPKEVLAVDEPQEMPRETVVLGELVSLRIEAPAGVVQLDFDGDGVQLASNAAGNQLYFVGGDQNLARQLATFGARGGEGRVRLGKVPYIVYETRKAMHGFRKEMYEHHLGEVDGNKPTAFYDPAIARLTLEGGNYRVEAPGIIN